MTKHAARIAILLMTATVFSVETAAAQTPAAKPATVRTATGQLGASINNAGLQQSFDFTASRPLTTSKSPWLADAHAAVGGSIAASPAGARAGVWVEVAPVSIWTVRAGVEPAQYFGTFHSLTSFDSRLEAFDAGAREARNAAASGRTMNRYLTQTLQLQAGHFAARATLNSEHWTATVPGPLFYEPTRDSLLAVDGDHVQSINSVLVYQRALPGGGQLMFGPMHSLVRIHSEHQLNRIQKAGVVAGHQMSRNHFGLIRPRVSAQIAYYIDDPSKKGQWSAAAAVGFALKRR